MKSQHARKFRIWLVIVRLIFWSTLLIGLFIPTIFDEWNNARLGGAIAVYYVAFGIVYYFFVFPTFMTFRTFSSDYAHVFITRHEIRDHRESWGSEQKYYFQAFMRELDIVELRLLFPFLPKRKEKE